MSGSTAGTARTGSPTRSRSIFRRCRACSIGCATRFSAGRANRAVGGSHRQPAGSVLGCPRSAARAAAADVPALRRPRRSVGGMVRSVRGCRRGFGGPRGAPARAGRRARGRHVPLQRDPAGGAADLRRSPDYHPLTARIRSRFCMFGVVPGLRNRNPPRSIMRPHLHLLGILQVVWGAIGLLLGVSMLLLAMARSRSGSRRRPIGGRRCHGGRVCRVCGRAACRGRGQRLGGTRAAAQPAARPARGAVARVRSTCSCCRLERRLAFMRSGCCCTTRRRTAIQSPRLMKREGHDTHAEMRKPPAASIRMSPARCATAWAG